MTDQAVQAVSIDTVGRNTVLSMTLAYQNYSTDFEPQQEWIRGLSMFSLPPDASSFRISLTIYRHLAFFIVVGLGETKSKCKGSQELCFNEVMTEYYFTETLLLPKGTWQLSL